MNFEGRLKCIELIRNYVCNRHFVILKYNRVTLGMFSILADLDVFAVAVTFEKRYIAAAKYVIILRSTVYYALFVFNAYITAFASRFFP